MQCSSVNVNSKTLAKGLHANLRLPGGSLGEVRATSDAVVLAFWGAPTSLLSVMGLQAIPYSKAASNWHATKALLAPPTLSLYGVGNNNILGRAR